MSVTLDDLRDGPRKVRTSEGRVFMLSAVKHDLDRGYTELSGRSIEHPDRDFGALANGPIGVIAYELTHNRPTPGQHRMLAACTRDAWFSELTLVND